MLYHAGPPGKYGSGVPLVCGYGMECNKHYPVPCHLQKAYEDLGYQKGDCPNAEYLASHCVTLPLFPEMTEEEVEMVVKACNAYEG